MTGVRESDLVNQGHQLVPPFVIPGGWVYQTCTQKGCDKIIGYWSKTGQPKPEYKNAKCERHRGGKSYAR